MIRRIARTSAMVGSLAAGIVAAQAPPAAPPPAQAGPPQTLDLSTAKRMVAAAEAAAVARNLKVAICVLDSNGDVVVSERMDGKSHNAIITSAGKARAALMFGVPTGQIADAIDKKQAFSATLTNPPIGVGGEYTLARGGIPVLSGGRVIGAIGVGGSPNETDEKLAQAGADAVALK